MAKDDWGEEAWRTTQQAIGHGILRHKRSSCKTAACRASRLEASRVRAGGRLPEASGHEAQQNASYCNGIEYPDIYDPCWRADLLYGLAAVAVSAAGSTAGSVQGHVQGLASLHNRLACVATHQPASRQTARTHGWRRHNICDDAAGRDDARRTVRRTSAVAEPNRAESQQREISAAAGAQSHYFTVQ